MKNLIAVSLLASSLLIVGCEKKDDTSTQMKKATDSTASNASDAMEKVKTNVAEGTDKAKDMAKSTADNAMANVDVLQKQIDDLITKTKTAVSDKKFDEADGYIKQIKDLETKLPQPAQDKINSSLGDVQKMIDAGKQMMPGK